LISKETITGIVEEKIAGTSLFIVEVIVRNNNTIIVYLDSDDKVSIDDCTAVSRYIESKLDREVEDFELEVSSAGIDRPLKHIRQYRKHIGRRLTVLTKDGLKREATLLEVHETGIKIEEQVKQKTEWKKSKQIVTKENFYDFDQIKETKIAISFK
jgi:ribosome maturation factor RimP